MKNTFVELAEPASALGSCKMFAQQGVPLGTALWVSKVQQKLRRCNSCPSGMNVQQLTELGTQYEPSTRTTALPQAPMNCIRSNVRFAWLCGGGKSADPKVWPLQTGPFDMIGNDTIA